MKCRFPMLILVSVFIGFVSALQAQVKLISAKIISNEDSSVITSAHIVNMNTFNATNSYSDGTFLMPFTQGDTLRLSHISFKGQIYLYWKITDSRCYRDYHFHGKSIRNFRYGFDIYVS